MERLAANLAVDHLMSSFTGAKQTDRLWCGGDRCKDAEAAHQPYILDSTVLLEIHADLVLVLQQALLGKSVS